jgi:hypothetical protein
LRKFYYDNNLNAYLCHIYFKVPLANFILSSLYPNSKHKGPKHKSRLDCTGLFKKNFKFVISFLLIEFRLLITSEKSNISQLFRANGIYVSTIFKNLEFNSSFSSRNAFINSASYYNLVGKYALIEVLNSYESGLNCIIISLVEK